MAGDKFAGIDIKWDYASQHCRISILGYINNLLNKFKHPMPSKLRRLPYKCLPIAYGAKAQLTRQSSLRTTANAESRRMLVHCFTMHEQWITSFWLRSAPLPPTNLALLWPQKRLSIFSLTMLLPTLWMTLSIDQAT
jgi:hypothetical protein